ncbi:MAG: hypothetical protein V3S29_12415 [bacterium]
MSRQPPETGNWQSRYNSLMRQIGVDPEASGGNRKTPRIVFRPPGKILLIHVGSHIGVLNDISSEGLSFFLNLPLTAKRNMVVDFDQQFQGKVEIVSTVLDEVETDGFRETYRTGARFATPEDGYRCVVNTLQAFSRFPDLEVVTGP